MIVWPAFFKFVFRPSLLTLLSPSLVSFLHTPSHILFPHITPSPHPCIPSLHDSVPRTPSPHPSHLHITTPSRSHTSLTPSPPHPHHTTSHSHHLTPTPSHLTPSPSHLTIPPSLSVADTVIVTSKHNDDKQYIWTSNGVEFSIAEDPRGPTLKRGSTVTLVMKEEAREYLEQNQLKQLVHKYSQFINFPIYLWESKVGGGSSLVPRPNIYLAVDTSRCRNVKNGSGGEMVTSSRSMCT